MKTRKLNSTSWAAGLNEEQSWELFAKARGAAWDVAASWAMKEFGLAKMPSRTAFYKWLNFMRKHEHAHSIKEGLLAQAMVKDIAKKYCIKDEDFVKQLLSVATNKAILEEDHRTAAELIEMAMAIRDRSQRRELLEIEKKRTEYKGEEIEILKAKLEIMQKREDAMKETVTQTKMTPEERDAKIREILGL